MSKRADSDERYVLQLVSEILQADEYYFQYRFDDLLGDPGKNGRCVKLPVDGYFPSHNLIVEY